MRIVINICKIILYFFIIFDLIMLGVYGLKQPDAPRAVFYGAMAIFDYLLLSDMSED